MRDVLTHDDIWCGAMTDLDQFWPACARSEDEAGPYQQQIELLVDHDKNVLNDLKQLLHNNNNHMDNRTLEGETVEGMYDVPYLVALFVNFQTSLFTAQVPNLMIGSGILLCSPEKCFRSAKRYFSIGGDTL